MSELVAEKGKSSRIQHYLLVSVSSAALLGCISLGEAVASERSDPSVWIDFGGQFEQLSDARQRWRPDFPDFTPIYTNFNPGPNEGPFSDSFPNAQKSPNVGYDASVSVSYHPDGHDWFISASAHLGRARRRVSDLTFVAGAPSNYGENVYSTESHRVLDFRVGKDVGIGLGGIKSSISLGVRVAKLRSLADVHISSNFGRAQAISGYVYYSSVINKADSVISHEFTGIGPSVEWKGTFPVIGDVGDGQIAIDGGVNVAVLFGRQTTARNVDGYYWERYWHLHRPKRYISIAQTANYDHMRRRSVTVPNLGGFIAASYRLPNVKLSLGYRADMYFNAMDGGVSSFKSEDRGFFGPYFNLSVGLGG